MPRPTVRQHRKGELVNTDRISDDEARAAYARLAPIVEMDGGTVDPRDEELTIQLIQGTITQEEMVAAILREKNIGQ